MIKYVNDMKIDAPCYVQDMPADIYHRSRGASNSGLKLMARSPAHFKYPEKKEPTRNLVIGSALHMAVLEPDLYKKTYIQTMAQDRKSKEYKAYADEFGGEFVLTNEESKKVNGIATAVLNECGDYVTLPGSNELSGFSIDEKTNLTCKHRFDRLTNCGIAIDLKTTIDARPDAFSRSINAYGYHVQAAFYTDQYNWITGDNLKDFIFIVVESASPYACKMYRLDQESLEIGRDIYRKCLDEYAECKIKNEWPAYDNSEIETISIPRWAINQHDNQLIESFVFTEE